MTKSLLYPTVLVLALAVPATAAAQSAPAGSSPTSCPPGSWFCAEAPQQQATPAGQAVQPLQPLPDADEPPPPPPPPQRLLTPRVRPHPPGPPGPPPPPPPVVVYQPPAPAEMWRPEMPPPYEYAPTRPGPISPPREWGLNARLEGAMIGRGTAGDAGMGGAGVGLRYKPTRSFGFEAGFDFLGGTDYQGDHRSETAFTLNGLVFLNPRSRAQLYLLAGFGWSAANVQNDAPTGPPNANYSYFGGQAGAGLELRLSRSLALDVDLRGFIRSRTDGAAQAQPEFTDQYGRSTNTSAGALLKGGMTLYF
jgi:hypothetical protein